MRSKLILRLVAAIVAALVVLAVLAHVVIFFIMQLTYDTTCALIALLVLIVCDAFTLVRLLNVVVDAFLGEEMGSDADA